MPIVLVHGVAVRVEDDPAFATVARFTGGFPMGPIEAQLRAHVTSAINPGHPDDVPIRTVYWGDLGTPPPRQASRHVGTGGADGPGNADELDRAALGELLEEAVRSVLPAALWPEAVWCTWRVVDEALADGTPPADLDLAELAERVRAGLVDGIPNLDHWYAHVLTRLQARSRERVRSLMTAVRRPAADFLHFFAGDVLRYVAGRGTPGHPGPIVARVMEALDEGHQLAEQRGEPLVVLTHSMGGQLVYDALTAFAGARRWKVDVWCAAGPQLGLFAQLGVFLEESTPDAAALADRVDYLWNVWSASDILSFPASEHIACARDTDFGYARGVASSHLAYLVDEDFYRRLAAKVAVHTAPARLGGS